MNFKCLEPTGLLRTFWENKKTQNSDLRAWGEYAMLWHFIGSSISPVNHISCHVMSLLCRNSRWYKMIYDHIMIISSSYHLFFHMFYPRVSFHKSLWSLMGWWSLVELHPPTTSAISAHRAMCIAHIASAPEFEATAPTQETRRRRSKLIEIDRNCIDEKWIKEFHGLARHLHWTSRRLWWVSSPQFCLSNSSNKKTHLKNTRKEL